MKMKRFGPKSGRPHWITRNRADDPNTPNKGYTFPVAISEVASRSTGNLADTRQTESLLPRLLRQYFGGLDRASHFQK